VYNQRGEICVPTAYRSTVLKEARPGEVKISAVIAMKCTSDEATEVKKCLFIEYAYRHCKILQFINT